MAARAHLACRLGRARWRACAGDGHEGIQAVFTQRKRPDGAMALVLSHVLQLNGRSVMPEPWRDRRKRLEDLVDGRQLPRIGIVPVTEDAAHLYETWVGMDGEGIVLKDPASPYRAASVRRRGSS
jgi:ATP-dependent DNA ligase